MWSKAVREIKVYGGPRAKHMRDKRTSLLRWKAYLYPEVESICSNPDYSAKVSFKFRWVLLHRRFAKTAWPTFDVLGGTNTAVS